MNALQLRYAKRVLIIAVCATALLLAYFFLREAKAAESSQILSGVVRINTGVCDMDAYGTVSSSEEKTAYSRKCNVGINPYKPTKRYISTFEDNNKIESVIEADTMTGTQTIIWHKDRKEI